MNREELEHMFNYINGVEDSIEQIEEAEIYEYIVSCLQNNIYCTIEDYYEYLSNK